MKRRFLINPTARSGAIRRLVPKLADHFRRAEGAFDAVITSSWEDAREQTRRALHAGIEQIVAVGGDGTLNAIVNGFFENGRPIRSEACLVPTDCGTGSDYFKAIVGRSRHPWKDLVAEHEARAVDVGCIEPLDPDRGETRYFLNIAGIGISPAIAGHKWQWGLPFATPPVLTYLVPTLRAIRRYRPAAVTVRGEGFEFEGEVLNCFVAKGHTCGGGMRIGGRVALDDGRFDVTVIGKLGLKEILQRLPLIYGSGLRDEEKIRRRPTSWLEIRSPQGLPVEFDGEIRATTDVRFSMRPRSVRLCFPRERAYT